MQLYYSGASNFEESQRDINLSLGNYISSDIIPNDQLNKIIRAVSELVKSKNDKQVFMLILKNTTASTVTDVTVHSVYPQNEELEDIGKYKLELAFVSPATDSEGNPVFEKIVAPNSLPVTATFAEYNRVDNAVNIGNIDSGSTVGIWFKVTTVDVNVAPKTDAELYEEYLAGTNLDTQEEITLSISYT